MPDGTARSTRWPRRVARDTARFVGRGARILVDVHDSIPGDTTSAPRVRGTGPSTLRIDVR